LFITVGVVSSGSHLDALPSTAPLSIWAAIFYWSLCKIVLQKKDKTYPTHML
jgi:hypothetical protein